LLGTSIKLSSSRTYWAEYATNQPDWKEKGKVFINGVLLESGEYEVIALEPQTMQELFDTASVGLLRQGKKSELEAINGCAYRGKGGRRCGVGFVIPDYYYEPDMEGRDAGVLVTRYPTLEQYWGVEEDGESRYMLLDLQSVHDNCSVECWRDELSKVAEKYGLETLVMDQVPLNETEQQERNETE